MQLSYHFTLSSILCIQIIYFLNLIAFYVLNNHFQAFIIIFLDIQKRFQISYLIFKISCFFLILTNMILNFDEWIWHRTLMIPMHLWGGSIIEFMFFGISIILQRCWNSFWTLFGCIFFFSERYSILSKIILKLVIYCIIIKISLKFDIGYLTFFQIIISRIEILLLLFLLLSFSIFKRDFKFPIWFSKSLVFS